MDNYNLVGGVEGNDPYRRGDTMSSATKIPDREMMKQVGEELGVLYNPCFPKVLSWHEYLEVKQEEQKYQESYQDVMATLDTYTPDTVTSYYGLWQEALASCTRFEELHGPGWRSVGDVVVYNACWQGMASWLQCYDVDKWQVYGHLNEREWRTGYWSVRGCEYMGYWEWDKSEDRVLFRSRSLKKALLWAKHHAYMYYGGPDTLSHNKAGVDSIKKFNAIGGMQLPVWELERSVRSGQVERVASHLA